MSNCWLDLKQLKKDFPVGYFIKKLIYAGHITGYRYINSHWTLEVNHGDWYLDRDMIF